MVGDKAERITLAEIHAAKLGSADAHRILQHGLEYRLQFAWRGTNDAQDFGRCCLLLQCLGKLLSAGLLRLEQPRVLDGDDRLVGEGLHESDLVLREGLYSAAAAADYANRHPAS